MTTWTEIPTTQLDQDSPVTQPLMGALRDNVRASAEASTGAPVAAAGWHPYDIVDVGDGNDGLIYDHSISGTVSTVETPDFDDGYDYHIVFESVSGSSFADLILDGMRDDTAGWIAFFNFIGRIIRRRSSRGPFRNNQS